MSFDQDKNEIIDIIKKHIPNCKIYLFGSRARGTNRPGSDIDIVLDMGKKIERSLIADINDELEESNIVFGVDVLDFNSISQDIKDQILKERVLWSS
ncbi:MAG: nucleotidyltransferase domain-containing protein [bacterium]